MAGKPALEVLSILLSLPFSERQTLLCTACSIRKEIDDSCLNHGEQVAQLLASECAHFIDGRRSPCLPERIS